MRATVVLCVSVAGCATTLTDQQARHVHVQNETAISRALVARGLEELPPNDLAEPSAVTVKQPTVIVHPQLGRALETTGQPNEIFVVDRSGAVHEARVVVHEVDHVRENVGHCAPGTSGGHAPARVDDSARGSSAPTFRHRYYKLREDQSRGPPIDLVVDLIRITEIYVTGHLCSEIP